MKASNQNVLGPTLTGSNLSFFWVAGMHSVQSKTKGYFPFFTQRHRRKKFMFFHRSRTYDHPVTTPDCLPLSYKRMAGYSVIFECNTDKMIIGECNFLYDIFFFSARKTHRVSITGSILWESLGSIWLNFIFLNFETTLLTCTYKRIQNKGNIIVW